MARPRANACSSGQTGTVEVQYEPPDEHHRRDGGLGGVVVLAGVLEDLLHGARRAGQEHDPRVADLQQDRLAEGVAEVLRDRGGEDVRRLVTVEPGRDPERRDVAQGRRPTGRRRPTRRPTGGTTGRPRARSSASVSAASGSPREAAHRGWPPPSLPAHRRSRPCGRDRAAQPSRAASAYAASPRTRACPPITPTRRPAGQPAGQRLVDRVVVQRLGEGVAGRRWLERPGVGPLVERVGVRRRRRTARRRCRATSGSSPPGRR